MKHRSAGWKTTTWLKRAQESQVAQQHGRQKSVETSGGSILEKGMRTPKRWVT